MYERILELVLKFYTLMWLLAPFIFIAGWNLGVWDFDYNIGVLGVLALGSIYARFLSIKIKPRKP